MIDETPPVTPPESGTGISIPDVLSPSTAAGPTAPRRLGQGAVSGAMFITASKGIGMAVSFVALGILARVLSPDDFGLVAMVINVTIFFTVFSDFGLSLVTVQRTTISQDELSGLFWVNMLLGVLLAAIMAALAPVLVWFYQEDRLLNVTLALSVCFPILTLSTQHQALLKRNMQFPRLVLVRLAGTVGGAMVGVVAALCGLDYWALVMQSLCVVLFSTIASFIAMPWWPGKPKWVPGLRGMLSFGGALTTHTFVGYATGNLDKILLGRFGGVSVLGLYNTSWSLIGRGISLTVHSVGEAAIPAMSRKQQLIDPMRALYRRTLSLSTLFSFPAFVFVAFSTDDVVRTLLGPQWMSAGVILRILCIAAIPRSLAASMGWVYVATGRPGRMLRWEIAWSVFVIAAYLLGMGSASDPLAKAANMSIAFAIAHAIALVPGFIYCYKGTGFRLYDLWQPSIAPLACALFAAAFAVVGESVVLPGLAPGALRLLIRVAVFVPVYGALTAGFVPLANDGFRRLFRRLSHVVQALLIRNELVQRSASGES